MRAFISNHVSAFGTSRHVSNEQCSNLHLCAVTSGALDVLSAGCNRESPLQFQPRHDLMRRSKRNLFSEVEHYQEYDMIQSAYKQRKQRKTLEQHKKGRQHTNGQTISSTPGQITSTSKTHGMTGAKPTQWDLHYGFPRAQDPGTYLTTSLRPPPSFGGVTGKPLQWSTNTHIARPVKRSHLAVSTEISSKHSAREACASSTYPATYM